MANIANSSEQLDDHLKKIVKNSFFSGATTLSEEESCQFSTIIEVISKKWTRQIIRAIRTHEKQRFNELVKNIHEINQRTLSNRLKELETYGLIHREQFNEIPPKVIYSLTLKGQELIESMTNLKKWSIKWD